MYLRTKAGLVTETGQVTVPQVFVEAEDGEMRHVLTGRPEGLVYTKTAVENLVKSELFASRD